MNAKKVVCLLSGGLDSPVACYTLITKGFTPVFLYFDNSPYTDETAELQTIDIAPKLTEYIPEREARMYIVPQGSNMTIFLENASKRSLRYTCIFCKRMMYRIAEKIALIEGSYAIATGEILGEQASQTLDNLLVLHQAIRRRTVLRPLISWDKEEVVVKAREIGTYEISSRQKLPCALPPEKPAIRGRLKDILEIESTIDIEAHIQESLKEAIVLKITPS
jgi:thiamine biosynthesis protein ThiI